MRKLRHNWMVGLALASCLAAPAIDAQSVAQEGPPMAKSAAEKRALEVLDDIDRNQRHLSVPAEDGRLLRILAASIGAKHIVELGTSTGYSGIWLALALRETGGKLTTYEIDPRRAAAARENFKRAGLDDVATVIVGDAHVEVTKLKPPIDLVFIDADKEGYIDYLNKLLPLVRSGGLIASHNMRVPPPDPQFVKAITTNPNLESVFLNMDAAGIAVTLKKH